MRVTYRLLSTIVLPAIGCVAQWTLDPGSIPGQAEIAKQKGETSITIPAPIGIHERITSLNQALSTYLVVVATPILSFAELTDRQ